MPLPAGASYTARSSRSRPPGAMRVISSTAPSGIRWRPAPSGWPHAAAIASRRAAAGSAASAQSGNAARQRIFRTAPRFSTTNPIPDRRRGWTQLPFLRKIARWQFGSASGLADPRRGLEDAARRAGALGCWRAPVDPQPLAGGITNTNFSVEHEGRRYFVRIGSDIPVHGVLRANELAASRAAHAAGVAPAAVHAEPGALVLEFIAGRTLSPADVREPRNLARIVELVKRAHRGIPRHLRGPAPMFWPFHVLRDYGHTLAAHGGRHHARLRALLEAAARLERAVGPIDVVFGHNDLLAANFIDDGARLWLVDWEYAGFNSPLFDLGGLASNSELAEPLAGELLEAYFERPLDEDLRRRFTAMAAASLLRETMWSMVSEIHSTVDFDYAAYTARHLARFEAALAAFDAMR